MRLLDSQRAELLAFPIEIRELLTRCEGTGKWVHPKSAGIPWEMLTMWDSPSKFSGPESIRFLLEQGYAWAPCDSILWMRAVCKMYPGSYLTANESETENEYQWMIIFHGRTVAKASNPVDCAIMALRSNSRCVEKHETCSHPSRNSRHGY